ncbi:MAG: glycosyl hydrolase family 79 C-terminal domain-containing protein [Rhizomicrobium sp.]
MGITRRTVLASAAAAPLLPRTAFAADNVSIRIDPRRRLRAIPADYMGLGFEASSVATPGLLSGDNHTYVQLVRTLGAQGVIRVGGNVSDFSAYDANGTSKNLPKDTVLTKENFRQLRSFLDATGWKLIWGLNLGTGKLDNMVEEARAIAQAAGDRLIAFEIGNEPDLFSRAGHRQGNYDYVAWHTEFRRYKAAIRAVLPRAAFAGPDIAMASLDWMQSFARDEAGDLALLTAHHYITGQANPAATLEFMLAEEKKYQPALSKFQSISQAARVPWRMCETASFSGGGKAGVSDTFAAALWALDYLFVLASYGSSGVNMETGVNHLGVVSKYTPISDDLAGRHAAAPEYYGLLAFAQAGKGEQLALTSTTGGVNLTAYATRSGTNITLTLINKDMSRDAAVTVSGVQAKQARVMRLAAPSLTATTGITLGGAFVDDGGKWNGGKSDPVKLAGGKALLEVPSGSAALVTFTA